MSQGRHIFLSYCSTDADFALKLAASLKNEGVSLWMDRLDIDPGDNWRKALGNALNGASAVIAVLSPGYVASKYCQRELARADRPGRLVFPILLGSIEEEDWPLEIERQQPIDFSQWRDEPAYIGGLHRLVDSLKAQLPDHFRPVPTAKTQYLTNLAVELETHHGMVAYLDRVHPSRDEDIRPERHLSGAEYLNFTVVENELPIPGYRSFARDMNTILDQYPRFVLLGEPGSGKTATLHHLALAAVRARTPQQSMPMLVKLADWDDRLGLKDFITGQWPLDSDPFKLMAEGGIMLYLDGLNEISSQRNHKVSALRTWLSSSGGPVIITCRKRDYTLDLNLGLPVVQIDDMQPAHIRRFANHTLDEAAAPAFLGQVLPHDTWAERHKHVLFDLARNLFTLSALLLAHKSRPENDLPKNKGTLLNQLTAQMWEHKNADTSLEQVTFDDLETALSQLAYAITDDEMGVYVPVKVALQHLGSEALLNAAHQARYLEIHSGKVRFTYQAQQEYFAARMLMQSPVEIERPQLDDRGLYVEGKWDRALAIQCCLTEQPDQMVLNIAKVNPFLALNCIAAGVEISESIVDPVIDKVLHFGGSPRKDVRVAIASILARIAPELALPILVETMRAGAWPMRSSATLALWELDARLLESLTQVMQDLEKVEDAALTAIRRLKDDALPTLIKLLRSEDRKIRRSATWALGELKDKAAVPGLVQMLYDSDTMVSEEAARALSLMKDEAAIPWLIETLRHSNVRVRKSAARALGAIGEPALKPLLEVMRDSPEDVSSLVAGALREIRLPVVTEILLDLTRATNDEVRCAAIEALDTRRDPAVVQRLIECLADETIAPQSRKRICDVAARVLENVDTTEAKFALEGWKMTQDEKFPAGRGKTASTARLRLQHITRPKTGPLPSVPVASEAASRPTPQPEPPPAEQPPPPIKPLKSLSPKEPEPAAPSLEILDKLIADIKRDSAWGQREDAAKALREYTATLHGLKAPEIVKRLEQELHDPNWMVRWAATEALASIGDPQAVPAVMAMVQDTNWTVRIAVVRSLLELGESSATEALLTMLDDKQSLVREAVAEALGALRGPNAFAGVTALINDTEAFVRLAAVHALPQFTDPQVELLALAALDDDDANVRWAAAAVLGKVGTAAAVDRLGQSLQDRDGPYWEKQKIADLAAAALERIGTSEADKAQGV